MSMESCAIALWSTESPTPQIHIFHIESIFAATSIRRVHNPLNLLWTLVTFTMRQVNKSCPSCSTISPTKHNLTAEARTSCPSLLQISSTASLNPLHESCRADQSHGQVDTPAPSSDPQPGSRVGFSHCSVPSSAVCCGSSAVTRPLSPTRQCRNNIPTANVKIF